MFFVPTDAGVAGAPCVLCRRALDALGLLGWLSCGAKHRRAGGDVPPPERHLVAAAITGEIV